MSDRSGWLDRDRWFSRQAVRRLPQVLLGTALFGIGIGLMARAGLGLGPWAVLHEGIGRQLGLGLGTVDVLLSFPMLAVWFPLRQRPGLGTVAASTLLGFVTNVTMDVVPSVSGWSPSVAMLLAGSVLIAMGSGLYLAADLGPGPRDGLMTGLHQRFGWPIRWVRGGIEVSVLVLGWLLGGTIGLGTVIHALLIGPLVHLSLRRWDKAGVVMRGDPGRAVP